MSLSYAEAIAQVTRPGERFETGTVEVGGAPTTVFVHAPTSLRQVFDTARARGDTTFLVYEDERWSFAEVMRQVDALGALLVDTYGVRKGDRVAIGMRNHPEWVVAFAAITSVGAISVSLNAWWTEGELAWALEDCGAAVLIADRERAERTHEAAAELGVKVLGVRLGADGAHAAHLAGVDRWEQVLPLGAWLPDVEVGPDDDATILYTSGTTGRPKGAVSTHRAVTQALMGYACRGAVDRLRRPQPAEDGANGGRPAPAFILVVPLFHVTGSIPVMLGCFSAGVKLVIMYRWDPERALELIGRERVTNFVGVPTQSWDLLQSPRFTEFDTSSLVSVGGGGAPAPPELVRRVSSDFRNASPTIGYGMTETNAYGPQNGGDDYLARPTSTGRATPILQIEVRDDAGVPVPTGELGEIWLRGPNLIRGYWNRPEATAETIVDGWLRTGDIGRLDAEGFVYIEDRAKDMVLRGGENVYSAEVEAALYEHPAVHEAAVFGVPHERLGEEVAAVVVPRAGETVTAAEIQAHVRERLAPFKVPSRIAVWAQPLPRNPAGKVLKRDLRDGFDAPS
ncbi:MAG TPA: class I adenylate-forming enzyme family protein [Acidimicrobiales bacterium]|nr:class I adenylate-forming enzyme family protein [Acidimicrobiales bacterium]